MLSHLLRFPREDSLVGYLVGQEHRRFLPSLSFWNGEEVDYCGFGGGVYSHHSETIICGFKLDKLSDSFRGYSSSISVGVHHLWPFVMVTTYSSPMNPWWIEFLYGLAIPVCMVFTYSGCIKHWQFGICISLWVGVELCVSFSFVHCNVLAFKMDNLWDIWSDMLSLLA